MRLVRVSVVFHNLPYVPFLGKVLKIGKYQNLPHPHFFGMAPGTCTGGAWCATNFLAANAQTAAFDIPHANNSFKE